MSIRGRIRVGALASGAASLAVLAGCGGGGKDFADQPRPPAPIQLNGVITNDGVNVSPHNLGAGPVIIQVSNQTQSTHTLTLDGGTIAPIHSAPIAPTDTGTIQITLARGHYTLKAGEAQAVAKTLQPARLVIGPPRQDSNDQVGLP
ncbi:MAG TPA: hypothetical protein VGI67_08445 [Thermoleophilaceae bacterium]|jgi:hypothetical protein